MTSSARTENRAAYLGDGGHERLRQQDAQRGTGPAEQQAFGEQGPPQRSGSCAERCPHGELTLAPYRTCQDQVGDVRTRDDEYDRGCAKEHEKDRSRRCRNLIAEPGHPQLDVGSHHVRLRVFTQDRGVHRDEFGTRRLEGSPGASRPKSSVMRCVRLVTIVAPR